jgi:hypothetical protein
MKYHRSPTFNEQVAFLTREKHGGGPPVTAFVDWGLKYAEMADGCRDWVREVLDLLDCAEGAVLLHCTTGKDRTGMISALLFGLCRRRGERHRRGLTASPRSTWRPSTRSFAPNF